MSTFNIFLALMTINTSFLLKTMVYSQKIKNCFSFQLLLTLMYSNQKQWKTLPCNPLTVDMCPYINVCNNNQCQHTKQLSIICSFQSHTNGGLLIEELADTTVINNMQRSDVHKVADRRHTQQSTAQLINVPFPQSPVKMPNCQSRNTQEAAGLEVLENRLKKAFFPPWYIWKEVRK